MNPFRVDGPASISFSGGRTSGLMLRRILDAHGGTLPADVFVVFANTGRERPETLDFVEEVSQRWSVPIVWLERVPPTGDSLVFRYSVGFREVTHQTASRNAEPFDALIAERQMLPNTRARFCTTELKVRTMHRWLRDRKGLDDVTVAVGMRADEPSRVVSRRGRSPRSEGIIAEHCVFPLYDAGITKDDVMRFWSAQSFDLKLQQHEGNCDLCFLKSSAKRVRIMSDRPDLAAWWVAHEAAAKGFARTRDGARFRATGLPFERLLFKSQQPTLLGILDDVDDLDDCACTD